MQDSSTIACRNVVQQYTCQNLPWAWYKLNLITLPPHIVLLAQSEIKTNTKKTLLVNKTIYLCFLGCKNFLGQCTSSYSIKHNAVGSHHTHFHKLHRHTIFAILQPQLANIMQNKNKSNQQANFHKINMLKNCIYFFYFGFPHGKRVPCSKYR